jgi:aspartokinase/homoserine dehydrogenase 1
MNIEGVFSGTLSYIFNEFCEDKSFSSVVAMAKKLGYTEPDPRDDLSGTDVGRKLVILAREMGIKVELDDVQIQSLVPENLKSEDRDGFMKLLPKNDNAMLEKFKNSEKKNEVLRYVGTISPEKGLTLQLKTFPKSHPFARITGSDNIVSFRTARYEKQPLIIQGPGAGPDVTAAGVFADLLRLASYLGAPF